MRRCHFRDALALGDCDWDFQNHQSFSSLADHILKRRVKIWGWASYFQHKGDDPYSPRCGHFRSLDGGQTAGVGAWDV